MPNADYVSPDEAVELLRTKNIDPEWIGWGLLGEQIKMHLRDLEQIGLRLVRTECDSSEDEVECLGPEGDCNESHVPPCPLAHG